MNKKTNTTKKIPIRTAQVIRFHPAEFIESYSPCDESWIARQLMPLGISISAMHMVKDAESLEGTVRLGLDTANLIVIIGGLGGDTQDAAKKVVAKVTDRKLTLSVAAQKENRAHLSGLTTPGSDNLEVSALIPQHGVIISSPEGRPSGFLVEHLQCVLICLPDECPHLLPLLLEKGLSWIREHFPPTNHPGITILRTYGLTEAELHTRLNDLFTPENSGGASFSLMSHVHGIDVQVRSNTLDPLKEDSFISLIQRMRNQLGEDLYGEGIQMMEEVVGSLLRQHHHTIATAESCTGGLIADRLTDIPGSSEYFLRGVVVYSNQAKQELLGVGKETLQNYGAVSEHVVREMCIGLKQSSRTDLTLAVSGIAGPGGGSAQKPVGLVYIGLFDGQKCRVRAFHFQGSRREIKFQSSQMALDLVRRYYL